VLAGLFPEDAISEILEKNVMMHSIQFAQLDRK
jgi:hypothetical protein